MHRIRCSEIWGGNTNMDSDVCTGGITASLFSSAADGGKGGDIYYISVCGSDLLTRIAIADVVGHGEAVSQVSDWLYQSLAARMNDGAGNAVLSDVNELACDHGWMP
jgi:phosphoserine phosphatase RsbU/P